MAHELRHLGSVVSTDRRLPVSTREPRREEGKGATTTKLELGLEGNTYFWMRLYDCHPPRPMRLLCHEPEKVRRILRRPSEMFPIVLLGGGGYLRPARRAALVK